MAQNKVMLHNPIDDEIKLMAAENHNSAALLDILKTIKQQYDSMSIETLKTNIDKVMSSSPTCLDREQVNKALQLFMFSLDRDAHGIANRPFIRNVPFLNGNLLSKVANVKQTIIESNISGQQRPPYQGQQQNAFTNNDPKQL